MYLNDIGEIMKNLTGLLIEETIEIINDVDF